MKRISQFLADCSASVRPITNLIRLPILRWKLSTLNPMCPADQLLEHILPINEMERTR